MGVALLLGIVRPVVSGHVVAGKIRAENTNKSKYDL